MYIFTKLNFYIIALSILPHPKNIALKLELCDKLWILQQVELKSPCKSVANHRKSYTVMQREFADIEERCLKFDGRGTAGKALLKRLRELVSQIHAHQVAPPPALVEALMQNVLPSLGNSEQDKSLGCVAYLLVSLGLETLVVKIANQHDQGTKERAECTLKSVGHAILTQEFKGGQVWRQVSSLRLYAQVLDLNHRLQVLNGTDMWAPAMFEGQVPDIVQESITRALMSRMESSPPQQSGKTISKLLGLAGSARMSSVSGPMDTFGISSLNLQFNSSSAVQGARSSSILQTPTSGMSPVSAVKEGEFSPLAPGSPGSASLNRKAEEQQNALAKAQVPDSHKKRSFLLTRRRSSIRSAVISNAQRVEKEVIDFRKTISTPPAAAFRVLREIELRASDVDAALKALSAVDCTGGASACLFIIHKARSNPEMIATRLFPYIPHCKQPTAADLLLRNTLTKVRWAELCSILACSSKCQVDVAQAFFLSLALLVRDPGPRRVRLASIAALSRCPWHFFNSLSLPAYPEGCSEEHVLSCVVHELLDTLTSNPTEATRYCVCQAIGALARERVVHMSSFGLPLQESANLSVLWPHLVAVCRTGSSEAVQLEAVKAMIWIASDIKGARTPTSHSSGRQIKVLTSDFSKTNLGEVLQTLRARVLYDPGLAWLLLDLAYSRYADRPAGLGVESLFIVWRSCLECADPIISSTVLRDLLALLDSPTLVKSRFVLVEFLGEYLPFFTQLSTGVEVSQNPSIKPSSSPLSPPKKDPVLAEQTASPIDSSELVREIEHRLLQGAMLDPVPATRHMCVLVLCRLVLLGPSSARSRIQSLLLYLLQQPRQGGDSLEVINITLVTLSENPNNCLNLAEVLAHHFVSPLTNDDFGF